MLYPLKTLKASSAYVCTEETIAKNPHNVQAALSCVCQNINLYIQMFSFLTIICHSFQICFPCYFKREA